MTKIKKVLVVDDEPDILVYLTAIFEDLGYETIYADGGVKAFDLARSENLSEFKKRFGIEGYSYCLYNGNGGFEAKISQPD
jgi:CheY-like chemotaxis protein